MPQLLKVEESSVRREDPGLETPLLPSLNKESMGIKKRNPGGGKEKPGQGPPEGPKTLNPMKIMKIMKFLLFKTLCLSRHCFEAPERCAKAQCSNILQRRGFELCK